MQILGLMADDFLLTSANETNEFDAAVESIESTFAAQKLMDSYRAFKEADLAQIALDEVRKTITTFVAHDLGLESNNQTLAEVTASFGCRPVDLGLEAVEEEVTNEEQPSRGRRLLNSIKSAGVSAKQGIKSGWNKIVETVKSWLGLNMIASQAFGQIETKAGKAIEKLNAAQGSTTLSDISVSGVDVNEFDGAIAHYKELIGALSKINKAKNGEASTIVNAIFGSLPKLLGIDSNGEAELLSAAKQLKATAKEKAVNVSHKITYAGPEGLKSVKNALTKLQKVAIAMKETENYADLVSALKGMKKGLSKEDVAKLKVIVKVSSLYVKASSDVLRSLVKGVDNLLKVSKSFEKLTGKSKEKDLVASTESMDYASDVIKRLQGLSAGMESFGYETGFESVEDIPNEYANYEDGLESIMMLIDQFDDIETSTESFVDNAVLEAIAPQVEKLQAYAESIGIEAEDATFELMANMSIGVQFEAGIEAEEAKDKESMWAKVKRKARELWEWLKGKVKEGWNKLTSKFRVVGALELKVRNFAKAVAEKAKAAGETVLNWLFKIPGVPAVLSVIFNYIDAMKVRVGLMKAFFKDPHKYLESKAEYDKFVAELLSEENLKKAYDKDTLPGSVKDKAGNLNFLADDLKKIKLSMDQLKVDKAFAKYTELRQDVYEGKDIPEKTWVGKSLDRVFAFFADMENKILKGLADLIAKVKGWFSKKDDAKTEEKK